VEGFDSDRSAFLGPYGDASDPAAVRARRSGNSRVNGWWPIASLCVPVTLQPGESQELVFATGYAENAESEKWVSDGAPNLAAARRLKARLQEGDHVERAFAEHRRHWDSLLGALQVSTPDARLNELVNTWNPYQCMVTFQLARSASLFETGRGRGIGFRDSNQDCLGVAHMVPNEVRVRLVHLAATQQSDGSAYHQYQPLTRTGNSEIGSGFNDDPLWLVLSVAAYVRETGRADLLEAAVPFEDAPDGGATMRDHLEASLGHTLARLGAHGLPLIGRADWNDCLNLNAHSTDPDESFQTAPMRSAGRAESVMIAALFVLAAREYAALSRALGDEATAVRHGAAADAMAASVEAQGWDGEWFLRAYDHAGEAIGSRGNTEGQIFLEPQALCAMAGIGSAAGLPERALQSVAERLASPFGIRLLDPPYQSYHRELGEISTYLPGYKENGSVFCHTNPWVIIAETLRGRADRAMQYLRAIAPTYQADPDTRRTEPYVYAQMVAGPAAATPGEAKNSWLTGTASWSHVATTQYILGLRATYEGLVVDPCIPADWPSFTARRVFRDVTYEIEVRNLNRATRGVRSLTMDGRKVVGNLLPLAEPGSTVQVKVELG
jgi:cellobiose phosphorylase